MSLADDHFSRIAETERRSYRSLFIVSFPLFLCVALISRLLPARLRPVAIAPGRFLRVVSDARAQAHSILPHAFMLR